ncbi:MAG TPA: hypothetical protein VGL59_04550 [Polyangia bacterium]
MLTLTKRMLLATGAVLVVGGSGAALAAGTKVFRHTTAKDFEEGEATGSLILPTGEVAAGMKTTRVPLEAAFVWCSALSRDGGTAYFGSGDRGQIFAVETGGTSGKAPKTEKPARKVVDLDAAWVTALAVRPDGMLLAGATPGGRVFVVDPKNGSARELAKLPAEHVWSLVHDSASGTTYVGTGSPGKIFAIDAKGKSRAIWDSGDKHVVSLLRAADGRLLAGTSEEAILFRVSLDGHAEALHDFEAEEVRAIARDGETIYVAVNDFEKATPPTLPGPVAAKGTRVVVSTAGTPSSAGALPRPGQRKAKAGLYRLESDGRIEQIFSTGDGYFTALQLDSAGGVYVASGTQGKVYHVAKDRTASLAVDLAERQALTLLPAGNGLLVGSGDVGGVYRARPAAGDEAIYLSKVLDAEFPARWGMARWHGTRGLTIETRSGNTAKPDVTWNAWRAIDHPQPTTGSGAAGVVGSPPGRYVQYRVGLGGPTGRLRDMNIFYLPQNQRARITEVGVADPTPPAAGAVRVHSSVIKLRWKTENPDSDDLIYRAAFRTEGESTWRPLGGAEPLTKAEYDWSTDGLPDGSYVVRVIASDERANPGDRALDFALESSPLLVDNRPPEVIDLQARYPQISGRARDAASNISAIEYAIDGGEWRMVAPSDGILDDPVEPFSFRLPALSPGPHAVTVRAWDGGDNVGAANLTVTAK